MPRPPVRFCCILLFLAASGVGAQAPVPVSGELQVNTYTTDNQSSPAVAVGPDGGFVVVWQSYGSDNGDPAESSIQGQRYASDGSPLAGEFRVNSYTTSYQYRPEVTMAGDGAFVVVWESDGSDGGDTAGYSIQAQRYASDGTTLAAQFQVNTYTTSSQTYLDVDAADDGRFVVVWQSEGSAGDDTDGFSIHGRRYAANGDALATEFQVNTYTSNGQANPSVAVDGDGDFVVVWQSFGPEDGPSDPALRGRRYASDGSELTDEFQVATYTTGYQAHPSVAMAPDGAFLVAWTSSLPLVEDVLNDIYARRYSSLGDPVGQQFLVNDYVTARQASPSVTLDAHGDFVVAWESEGPDAVDPSAYGIRARRFASDGAAQGTELQVNVYTTATQRLPNVAAAPFGDFVVTWANGAVADGSTGNVQARRYRVTADAGDRVWVDTDADGIQDGGEPGVAGVTVNLYDDLGGFLDTATTDADGLFRFVTGDGSFYLEFDCDPASFTTPDQGGDDTLDSDAATTDGTTATFALSLGDSDSTWDAGLLDGDGDGFACFDLCLGNDDTGDSDGDGLCADRDCDDGDSGNACHIFSDGFESGDTTAWTVP